MTSRSQGAMSGVLRLLSDFGKCGVVGEANNKLLGYLAAVSRKLPSPLAVMTSDSLSLDIR